MKKLIQELKKLSKKQATIYSLAVCFCVFYVSTLAPAVVGQGQPAAYANDTPGTPPSGAQIEVTTLPPDGRVPVNKAGGQLGSFSAIGVFVVPAETQFLTSGDKNIGYYRWTFGDQHSPSRNSASGPNPRAVHTYMKPGSYHIVVEGYMTNADFENKKIADIRELDISITEQRIEPRPASKNGWIWPCVGVVTSRVGWRWGYEMHEGIDISNRLNTPIVAARDGVVVKVNLSGWGGGYGKYVIIRHSNGLYSIYGHLNKVSAKVGDHVYAGTRIGLMGTTGRSTGVHLHFGIGRTMMVNSNVLNPLSLLPKR